MEPLKKLEDVQNVNYPHQVQVNIRIGTIRTAFNLQDHWIKNQALHDIEKFRKCFPATILPVGLTNQILAEMVWRVGLRKFLT